MNRLVLLAIIVLIILGGIVGYSLTRFKTKEPVVLNPILSISAFNLTKNVNAVSVSASVGDEITYSVSAENHSDKVIRAFVIQLDIRDLSELSTLVNAAGGNYNSSKGTLAWTPLDIQPYSAREKKFTVKINKNYPIGSDLIMSVKYNNDLRISVADESRVVVGTNIESDRVMGSSIEQNNYQAPVTGPNRTFEFMGAIIVTAGFFVGKLFKSGILAI